MNFLLNKSEHTVGDHRCLECYRGYPAKCLCGGFIHAQFLKEDWQSNSQLSVACDVCGDKYKFPGQKPIKPKYPKRKVGLKRHGRQ